MLFSIKDFEGKLFFNQTSTGEKYITGIIDSYGRDFIFSKNRGQSYSEPFTSRLIQDYSFSKKGLAVFAGGYIGDLAIPAAKAGLECLAFEPDTNSAELMVMNGLLNNVSLTVEKIGLSHSKGSAFLSDADAISSMFDGGNQLRSAGKEISLIDLDTYIHNSIFSEIPLVLLQFDMEGAETDALLGSKNLIDKFSPLLVIEIHSLYDDFRNNLLSSRTVMLLEDLGYKVFALRDFNTHCHIARKLKYELIPVSNCFVEGPHHGFNLLAFKGDMPDIIFNNSIIVHNLSPKLIPSKNNDFRFRLTNQ